MITALITAPAAALSSEFSKAGCAAGLQNLRRSSAGYKNQDLSFFINPFIIKC